MTDKFYDLARVVGDDDVLHLMQTGHEDEGVLCGADRDRLVIPASEGGTFWDVATRIAYIAGKTPCPDCTDFAVGREILDNDDAFWAEMETAS